VAAGTLTRHIRRSEVRVDPCRGEAAALERVHTMTAGLCRRPSNGAGMKYLVLSLALIATPAMAQRPKPVVEQPTPLTGVSSATYGPKMPVMPRKTDPASRGAQTDTMNIRQALSRKLHTKDVERSAIVIQSDTAWVSLTDPKYRGVVYRLERHHTWKVVE
jgi:hypothetical protein